MAAPTWTSTDPGNVFPYNRNAKAVVAGSGTANDIPSGTSVGVSIDSAMAVQVTLSADSGQTLSGAGALECYYYSPIAALWSRLKSWDLSVATEGITAGTYRACTFTSNTPGFGQPVIHRGGRLAWVPNGVTISAGGCTVWIDTTAASPAM